MSARTAFALCSFLLAAPCFAQEKKPEAKPDIPRAVVADVRKTPEGGLLFAVRVFASNSKPLSLSRTAAPHAPLPPNAPPQAGLDDPLPFSIAGSTLRDLNAGQTYTSIPRLPDTPFVGPMEALTTIAPGGWLQLGVAFPPIPLPPPGKDGKKQPYLLLLEIPQLKISTTLKLDPDTLKLIPLGHTRPPRH